MSTLTTKDQIVIRNIEHNLKTLIYKLNRLIMERLKKKFKEISNNRNIKFQI